MSGDVNHDVVIVGAGLTGLFAAALLIEQRKKVLVVEANSRIGGRIKTVGMEVDKPIEMGATWLGSQHSNLLKFVEENSLEIIPQVIGETVFFEPLSTSPPYLARMPLSEDPSYRIKGGTQKVLDVLMRKIGKGNISLSERIDAISLEGDAVILKSSKQTYLANKVITTLPPNLLVNRINFQPPLPNELREIAKTTHTWMGESIKIALSFARPFWRDENFSGTIFSNVGPINEMYDHSTDELEHYVLKGFFNGNYYSLTKEDRLVKVLSQLQKYYGDQSNHFLKYEEKVWRNDQEVFQPYDSSIVPHQNQGHGIYSESFFENKLIIAGTETSNIFPGYMEGAIVSAINAVKRITKAH